MSKIHKSAEVDITDPTEDNRRELFEEDRIIAQINSLPDPFKGYCSWLFLGTNEIVSALLDGRDVVEYVGELDVEDADSARQVEICIAIAGRLRRAAAAFSREYKSADILEAFSSDFADEIAEDNPLAEILQDFWKIVGKSGAYREELLKDTFSKTDLPKVKQKSLLKVFENLCEVLSRLDEAEMPPLPAEAVPNDVITACCEKLSANLRSLYGYVHNALCAYIQDRTDDRLSVLEYEMAQNSGLFKVNFNSDTVVRLKRIRQLLKEAPRPMTFEDFISFSKDHNDGDGKSLFNERTQGVLIADIAPDGNVRMYQRVRKNPLDRNSEWVEEIFDLRERIK